MAIEVEAKVQAIDQQVFHEIDYEVMRAAFKMHNEMGRFCDEAIYQAELARRCGKEKLVTCREVRIRVTHANYLKDYFADLVVAPGAVYELKAVNQLIGRHEDQLLNYLLLMGMRHGKLINFRAGSVECRYVSTSLRTEDRYDFNVDDENFSPETPGAEKLRAMLVGLLRDWGVFLDIALYRDALMYLSGYLDLEGEAVDLYADGLVVGHQTMALLDYETTWHISSVKKSVGSYEMHLKRLLAHTHLRTMHWINLKNHHVSIRTLTNESRRV